MTLVELLVAIAIVGLLAGVVGLAVRYAPPPSESERRVADVAAARRAAVREGRRVTIELRLAGRPHAVTALPDGQVVAEPAVLERLGIDRVTGARRAERAGTDAR